MSNTSNVAQHKLSQDTCVKHIAQGLLMGKRALTMELSVCVAIFAGAGNISKQTKRLVVDIYKKAGYQVDDSKSAHYKTVNRRVNASAALYSKLGAKKVASWIGNSQEDLLLVSVAKGLDEHKFDSMDDVLHFAGKSSNKDKAKPKAARATKPIKPAVPMQVFRAPHIKVEVPQDTPSEVLMKLAAKIIKAAREKEQQELKAAVGHLDQVKTPEPVAVLH